VDTALKRNGGGEDREFATWITAGRRSRSYRTDMEPRHPPVTQAVVPVSAADTPIGPPGENEEDRLDEAIQETFPASDPIATHIEGPADYDRVLRDRS
jgi:hypothetical protein